MSTILLALDHQQGRLTQIKQVALSIWLEKKEKKKPFCISTTKIQKKYIAMKSNTVTPMLQRQFNTLNGHWALVQQDGRF